MTDIAASSAADRALLLEQQKAALHALKQAAEAVHSELEGKEWIETLVVSSAQPPAVTDAQDDRNREVALYVSGVKISMFLHYIVMNQRCLPLRTPLSGLSRWISSGDDRMAHGQANHRFWLKW